MNEDARKKIEDLFLRYAAGVGRYVRVRVGSAESVSFKLYRVERPEELVYGAKNIGKDYLYRDHRLDDDLDEKVKEHWERDCAKRLRSARSVEKSVPAPEWTQRQLVQHWNVRVADLKRHSYDRERRYSRRWDDDRWYDEADAHYFDDECSQHRSRIDKVYRPHDEYRTLSSWQCDRVVQVPQKLLAEAGAYVLVAEANGQLAQVPIVVEPLSLTLRRCRDGVFALVSDAEGSKPLKAATILSSDPRERGARGEGAARTDKEGVAFARILAYGDRPIIAHHEGRYAIGGFGQVFEGIYDSPDDERFNRARDSMRGARRGDVKETSASIYEDRHVVVAYTDRPTYRPGQDVHFKLIVRKLHPDQPLTDDAARLALTFRGAEFDARAKMILPDLGEPIAYDVFDPKGRAVAHGSLNLGEFGTAAGRLSLNTESVVGSYTFRVRLAGQPRIVPGVFAVKHYRRPHFEVSVTGVPETLTKPETLTLNVSSRYYFGPPLTSGTVEVRVVRKNLGTTIVENHGKLDAKGQAKLDLRLPRSLDVGKYLIVCSVTDDSSRTVSTAMPFALESPDAPKGTNGLAILPRFHPIDQELTVTTASKEVIVEQKITSLRFAAKNGIASLKFPAPGWYRLTAGNEDAAIFVYGGKEHPLSFPRKDEDRDDRAASLPAPKWVNLSDFALEVSQHLSRGERPAQHLYALFDRHSAKVGAKLRLLVYVPHREAKLLFTLEGRTILDYAIIRSRADAGPYQVVEIPIKERYFPNVYLQGRVVASIKERPHEERAAELLKLAERKWEEEFEELDPRWCRIDVIKPAGKSEGGLHVKIETDQAAYRPGDSVRATVKVTDRAGRPQSAELSFAAIDESVFTFGEDNPTACRASSTCRTRRGVSCRRSGASARAAAGAPRRVPPSSTSRPETWRRWRTR